MSKIPIAQVVKAGPAGCSPQLGAVLLSLPALIMPPPFANMLTVTYGAYAEGCGSVERLFLGRKMLDKVGSAFDLE